MKRMERKRVSSVSEVQILSFRMGYHMMRKRMTQKKPLKKYKIFSRNIELKIFQKNSHMHGMVSCDILTHDFDISAKTQKLHISGTISAVMVLASSGLCLAVGK